MKAVDTNVIVRLVAEDDSQQSPVARSVFQSNVYISHGVLMETEWVLRSRYRWSKSRIVAALESLLMLETTVMEQPELIRWSLQRYLAGADFDDMLHLIAARRTDAFLTFEKHLDDFAGPASPVPTERLQ